MRTSESFGAIVAALLLARSEIPALRKRGNNPDTNSKYVKLDDMVPAIIPALRAHGILVMQSSEIVDRVVVVRTRFMLTLLQPQSVEWIEADSSVPLVGRTLRGGAKGEADPQSGGSAISYARRYGLATALCLVADEDDDGRGARPREAQAKATAAPQTAPQTARETPSLQTSMSAQKSKRAFAAKAAKYVAGSFVIPAGASEGQVFTTLPREDLAKWIDYAKKSNLTDLLLDAEMALAEVLKHAAKG